MVLIQLTEEQEIHGARRQLQEAMEKLSEAQVAVIDAFSTLLMLEERRRRDKGQVEKAATMTTSAIGKIMANDITVVE